MACDTVGNFCSTSITSRVLTPPSPSLPEPVGPFAPPIFSECATFNSTGTPDADPSGLLPLNHLYLVVLYFDLE